MPATVTSALARMPAFAVMGPANGAKVVTALTIRLCPPEAWPKTVLPVVERVPPTLISDVATTGALIVTGPDVDAKVVAALTVRDCPPAADPKTVLPLTVRSELDTMAALAVTGPEAKVVWALTVRA